MNITMMMETMVPVIVKNQITNNIDARSDNEIEYDEHVNKLNIKTNKEAQKKYKSPHNLKSLNFSF